MVWLKCTPLPQPLDEAALPCVPPGAGPACLAPLDLLRRWLEAHPLPHGSRLPSERQLAAELHIGRPALREALRALGALGQIASRRGAGHYLQAPAVAPRPVPEAALAPDPEHLREARMALECSAAQLAAARGAPDALRAAAAQFESLGGDELDRAFHFAVVRAARNPVLLAVAQTLVSWSPPDAADPADAAAHERHAQAHREVLDALAGRDPDAAAAALRRHWMSRREHACSE
jgi:DNA-binding FadR family transcriptional regulator